MMGAEQLVSLIEEEGQYRSYSSSHSVSQTRLDQISSVQVTINPAIFRYGSGKKFKDIYHRHDVIII